MQFVSDESHWHKSYRDKYTQNHPRRKTQSTGEQNLGWPQTSAVTPEDKSTHGCPQDVWQALYAQASSLSRVQARAAAEASPVKQEFQPRLHSSLTSGFCVHSHWVRSDPRFFPQQLPILKLIFTWFFFSGSIFFRSVFRRRAMGVHSWSSVWKCLPSKHPLPLSLTCVPPPPQVCAYLCIPSAGRPVGGHGHRQGSTR